MPAHKSDRPRNHHVSFFLSTEDAERLHNLAKDLGLRSRGTLMTWITENLLNDDFAPISAARMCLKLLKVMKQKGLGNEYDFSLLLPRKLPDFPDVKLTTGDIDKAIQDLERLKTEIKNQR